MNLACLCALLQYTFVHVFLFGVYILNLQSGDAGVRSREPLSYGYQKRVRSERLPRRRPGELDFGHEQVDVQPWNAHLFLLLFFDYLQDRTGNPQSTKLPRVDTLNVFDKNTKAYDVGGILTRDFRLGWDDKYSGL